MSNAIRLSNAVRLDPASVRRQFGLSVAVGLTVLAIAAAHALQPAHGVVAIDGAHRQAVSAPQFVVFGSAPVVAQRSATFGALVGLN